MSISYAITHYTQNKFRLNNVEIFHLLCPSAANCTVGSDVDI